MNSKQLNELENNELQKIDSLYDQIVEKLDHGNGINYVDLYPELESKLENQTFTNSLGHKTSVLTQLPYYDSVILPIFPLQNEKVYEKSVGITVEQTIELSKVGKIIPVLQIPPLDFVNLDYLDPILELDLPVFNIRFPAFQIIRAVHVLEYHPNQMQEWCDECTQKLEKFNTSENLENEKTRLSGMSDSIDFHNSLMNNLDFSYANLHLSGFGDLANDIVSLDNFQKIKTSLEVYDHFLTGNSHHALGGMECWNPNDVLAAKNLGLSSYREYPVDIGKFLVNNLKLVTLENHGFGEIIEITKQTDKARNALFQLDDAIEKLQQDKIIDRSNALSDLWKESNEIIDSMNKDKNQMKKFYYASLGIFGPALAQFDLPGIIASVLGMTTIFKFDNFIFDTFLKLGKPNHVVTVYDLEKTNS
ncbi:hypothetical protein JYT57_00155 [Nitrosarchaeum koreense]|nr:hypothetical protein [Nitrosarchaeum koreense]